MKKLLYLMWFIIIVGLTFIIFHYTNKPSSTPTSQGTEKDLNIIIEETIIEEEKEPENLDENIKMGDQKIEEKDYAKAIDYYRKALSLDENSLPAITKLTEAYLINSESEKAKETAALGVKKHPNDEKIKILLAKTLLNTKATEEAVQILSPLSINNEEAKYYLALSEIIKKNPLAAEKLFREIIDEKTGTNVENKAQKFVDAYNSFSYYKEANSVFKDLLLAKAMTDNDEFEMAIPLLFEIITAQNNYRDAWIVLGYAYLNTNNPDEAIDALIQAKDLDPEKAETLYFLGLAYFANNGIDNAISYIKKAEAEGFEPKEQINLKLADLYLLKKNYDLSSKYYEKLLAENDNIELYTKAVWLNIEKNDNPNQAINIAEKALKKFPKNAMSLNLLGWAYTAKGDYKKAQEYLNQSLELDPELDSTNLNLGWLYELKDMNDLAKEYYKKAYILGKGNEISDQAAEKFNKLTETEAKRFKQINITAP